MSADLDKTLGELGSEYAGVVARLKSSCEIEPRPRKSAMSGRKLFWPYAAALAAAVVLAVMLSGVWRRDDVHQDGRAELPAEPPARTAPLQTARIHSEYSLAFNANEKDILNELVDTQNPDGSWGNDFLTRQNATALKKINQTSVAFRKAMRYLRSKGLRPLDDREFFDRQREYRERFLSCRS